MPDAIALARSVCPARSLERRDSNDWILVPRRRVSWRNLEDWLCFAARPQPFSARNSILCNDFHP